jgi:putative ABC transport system ATP-binding protein
MFNLQNIKYKTILDIKELIIPKNKITCIMGPSGGGKTTLLKLLNKMITQTNGVIYYNGKSLSDISSVKLRRNVVMLSQNSIIFEGNIKENLIIGLKFSEKHIPEDYKLKEFLNSVNLKKDLYDTCDTLSGGEKQRLCLARVMVMDADVYLLDEPSSALDKDTEYDIISQISYYCKKNNKTLIMITHSLEVSNNFADYIVNITSGEVVKVSEVKR